MAALDTGSCAHVDTARPLPVAALVPPVTGTGDLEVHLLQAFSEYAGDRIVQAYAYLKNSSRVLGFAASSTEAAANKSGLVAIVRFFYSQYVRLGHPIVRYVDDAVGRCVVATFVRLLLAVENQQKEDPSRHAPLKWAPELTYYERLQGLLYGHVPRLQSIILELRALEEEAKNQPPPVAFNPEDYVEKQEFERLQQETSKSLADKKREIAVLQEQIEAAEATRLQLEQDVKTVEAREKAERLNLTAEKEHQISLLTDQVHMAELARAHLKQELDGADEQRFQDRAAIVEETEKKVTSLKHQVELVERAREQLKEQMNEALRLKEAENREALALKEKEVVTLKNEIATAELAREKLEADFKATRARMETEHARRVKELEEELERTKQAVTQKDHDLRASSLRQQRVSFNANLVKDYVQPKQLGNPPRSPVAPRSPVGPRSPAGSNNQLDHETNSTRSSPANSVTSMSPRTSVEDKEKAKIDQAKLTARMHRVLGSRF